MGRNGAGIVGVGVHIGQGREVCRSTSVLAQGLLALHDIRIMTWYNALAVRVLYNFCLHTSYEE